MEDDGWSSDDERPRLRQAQTPTWRQKLGPPAKPVRATAPTWRAAKTAPEAARPAPAAAMSLARNYSSSDSWSDDEMADGEAPSRIKPHLLSAPPPTNPQAPPRPQAMAPAQSLPQIRTRAQPPATAPAVPSWRQAVDERNRASRISAGSMENKYGMGFSLMSKMGLSEADLKKAATPVIPEPRARSEGISSGPSLPSKTTRQPPPNRKRSRAEAEERLDLTSEASVSDTSEEAEQQSPTKQPRRLAPAKQKPPPPPPTIKESLEQIREATKTDTVVDLRGPVPKRVPMNEIVQRPPTLPARVDTLAARIAALEDELMQRCEQARARAKERLEAEYGKSESAVSAPPAAEDDEDQHLRLGGAQPVAAAAASPAKRRWLPTIGPLILDWLLEELAVVAADFAPEMKELQFPLYLDQLAEHAILADLSMLIPEASGEANPSDVLILVNTDDSANREALRVWASLLMPLRRLKTHFADGTMQQVFDNLMTRTVVSKFLEPFIKTTWDPLNETEAGVDLFDGFIRELLSEREFQRQCRTLVVPRLLRTLDEGKDSLETHHPHLWLQPWLPVLNKDLTEVIIARVTDAVSAFFTRLSVECKTDRNKLLSGHWALKWKDAMTKEQWDTVIFQGVFGLLKRWLSGIEPATLSTQVPEMLAQFLQTWRQHLPIPLITSTVIDLYGTRMLGVLREQPLNAAAALDGYASWKLLRRDHLPELKSFLKEVLELLEQRIPH